MILVKGLEPTAHRHAEFVPAPETRPLPLPIGLTPKAPSAFPSDDDWETEVKWDLQDSMLLGREFTLSDLF
jgi:hypothetical protein